MRYKEFNKFGGTELRVKDQIKMYETLYHWIIENNKRLKNKSIEEINKIFVSWINKEEIYSYAFKGINRFSMALNNMINKFNFFDKIDNKSIIFKSNVTESKDIVEHMFLEAQKNVKAWHELLFFIHSCENKKSIDWKRLFLAFAVYDGDDDFKELYMSDIIAKIVNKIYRPNFTIKNFGFRKPPSELIYIEKILNSKIKNTSIDVDDLLHWNISKSTILKKIVVIKKNEKIDEATFIKRINNTSKENYIKLIIKVKTENLLYGEYLDLFNRFCYGFNLISSRSKKVTSLCDKLILKKIGKYFFIEKIIHNNIYPFTKDEASEIILEIDKSNFWFKTNTKYKERLSNVANSVIAEYMVNLYYCLKHNIKPRDFMKFSNTKIDNITLLPIFTAPGGVSDFHMFDGEKSITIETTIHRGVEAILRYELYSCSEHAIKNAESKNIKIANLIFVSLSDDTKIKDKFNLLFDSTNDNYKSVVTKFRNLI